MCMNIYVVYLIYSNHQVVIFSREILYQHVLLDYIC
jgi:hypothetical protein